MLLGLYLLLVALLRPIYVMLWLRPERLTLHLLGELREWLTVERFLRALPPLLVLPVIMGSFTFFKIMIPVTNPFDWDPALSRWDQLLHGGRLPWEWLQPLLGYPWLTSAVNFFYHLWLFVIYGALFWQVLDLSRPQLRMKFLIAFALSWIVIGNVAATAMSSVGPVYFGNLYGVENDPYAPLMRYLQEANRHWPVWSLSVQDLLWESYAAGDTELGRGISAMPSMHVATSFLLFLLGRERHRLLGLAFGTFAVLIQLGSVHLGWHYAIDGYLACALVAVLWWGLGRVQGNPAGARRAGPSP